MSGGRLEFLSRVGRFLKMLSVERGDFRDFGTPPFFDFVVGRDMPHTQGPEKGTRYLQAFPQSIRSFVPRVLLPVHNDRRAFQTSSGDQSDQIGAFRKKVRELLAAFFSNHHEKPRLSRYPTNGEKIDDRLKEKGRDVARQRFVRSRSRSEDYVRLGRKVLEKIRYDFGTILQVGVHRGYKPMGSDFQAANQRGALPLVSR